MGDVHHGAYEDAHQHHHQQEARAAAGVEAALGPHVLHGQLLAVLVAEDGLVLGAVVGEEALDIAHVRNELHVGQQDDDLERALGEVAHEKALRQGPAPAHEQRGQEDEQQHRQGDSHHDGQADDELLRLVLGEMLLDPLVELVRLALLLERDEACRIGQRLHAVDERADKNGAAAQEGQAEHGIFVSGELELVHLFHKALRGTADDGLLFRAAHEDAFDQSLTADGGAEGAGSVVFGHGVLLGK